MKFIFVKWKAKLIKIKINNWKRKFIIKRGVWSLKRVYHFVVCFEIWLFQIKVTIIKKDVLWNDRIFLESSLVHPTVVTLNKPNHFIFILLLTTSWLIKARYSISISSPIKSWTSNNKKTTRKSCLWPKQFTWTNNRHTDSVPQNLLLANLKTFFILQFYLKAVESNQSWYILSSVQLS